MGAGLLNSEFKFVHEHDSGGGNGFLASCQNLPMKTRQHVLFMLVMKITYENNFFYHSCVVFIRSVGLSSSRLE